MTTSLAAYQIEAISRITDYNDITILLTLYPELNWTSAIGANPNMTANFLQAHLPSEYDHSEYLGIFGNPEMQKMRRMYEALAENPNSDAATLRQSVQAYPMAVARNPSLPIGLARELIRATNGLGMLKAANLFQALAANPAIRMEDLPTIFNMHFFNQKPEGMDAIVWSAFGQGLSSNPNVTVPFVQQHRGIAWHPRQLAANPAMSIDDLDALQLYFTDVTKNPNIIDLITAGRKNWDEIINEPTNFAVELHQRIIERDAELEQDKILQSGVIYDPGSLNKFIERALLANGPIDERYLLRLFANWETRLHENKDEEQLVAYPIDIYWTLPANPNLTWRVIHNVLQAAIGRGIDVTARDNAYRNLYYELPGQLAQDMTVTRKYMVPHEFKDIDIAGGLQQYWKALVKSIGNTTETNQVIDQILDNITPERERLI